MPCRAGFSAPLIPFGSDSPKRTLAAKTAVTQIVKSPHATPSLSGERTLHDGFVRDSADFASSAFLVLVWVAAPTNPPGGYPPTLCELRRGYATRRAEPKAWRRLVAATQTPAPPYRPFALFSANLWGSGLFQPRHFSRKEAQKSEGD